MNKQDIDDWQSGDFVYAKAGRDKDKIFIIISVLDNYVLMCDGQTRRIERPKLKKFKHIKSAGRVSKFIADKLGAGEKPTNKELRNEIRKYIEAQDKQD